MTPTLEATAPPVTTLATVVDMALSEIVDLGTKRMLDDPTRALYRAPQLVLIDVGSAPGLLEVRA
jgi:hypothetical protein